MPTIWGDFWPLTPYSLENNVWIAWQFDEPEEGEGVVQAFRRAKSEEATKIFKLVGLDPNARYVVTNLDTEVPTETSGQALMETGLSVEIKDQPGGVDSL